MRDDIKKEAKMKMSRARQGDKNLFNLCSYLFSNKIHFR